MKIGALLFILIALLVVPTGIAIAQEERISGQNRSISVQTDDTHYEEGDVIVIFGTVGTIIPDQQVTLQIFVNDILIEVAQIQVAQGDKRYSHTTIAKGEQWNKNGDYIVRALYGEGNVNQAVFTFIRTEEIPVVTSIFDVDAGSHGTFDVKYTIKGGQVNDISVDSENLGIVIQITADDEGFITMELPRKFIGAEKQSGRDEVFIILIDDMQTEYDETIVETESRIIKVDFLPGDSKINVIGTYVVPEFGTIVMIMLLVAMTSMILAIKIGIIKPQLRQLINQ